MERILLRNGIPEPMPRIESAYLYQTLHVRGRRPLWLDRHTELLARSIQELFGLRWVPDLRRLETQIAALLDANRHPAAGSSFVRMAFTPTGDLLLIPGAVSLYDGYALRSLRPAAAVVNYGVPYPEYHTSAREAACMLALQAAVTSMSGDAAPSGSTATRSCWLAAYKNYSGCAGSPTFVGWRRRSPPCSTPTVTPPQALRSYAWPSHRRATCC